MAFPCQSVINHPPYNRTKPNAQRSVRFNKFYLPKSAALRILLSPCSSLANIFLSLRSLLANHSSLDLLDYQSQSYSPTVPHLGSIINLVHLPAPLSNIGQTHSWLFGDRNPARSTYVHWYLPMKDLWNCDNFLWNTFVNKLKHSNNDSIYCQNIINTRTWEFD